MDPKLVHGSEGTERCPVFMGPKVDHFVCYCWKNKYVFVCKNHVNRCLRNVLTWNYDEWKLYVGNIIIRNL